MALKIMIFSVKVSGSHLLIHSLSDFFGVHLFDNQGKSYNFFVDPDDSFSVHPHTDDFFLTKIKNILF
jgi:hypothetical protein